MCMYSDRLPNIPLISTCIYHACHMHVTYIVPSDIPRIPVVMSIMLFNWYVISNTHCIKDIVFPIG